jgi:hypothetical protein
VRTVVAVPPQPPANLRVLGVTQTTVELLWEDRSENETGFQIQARAGAGTFVTVANPGAGVQRFIVTGLVPYTAYTFRIRSVGDGGSSSFEAGLAYALTHPLDTSTPMSPDQPLAVPLSDGRIALRWRDRADNEIGYRVERRVGGQFQIVAQTTRDFTGFEFDGFAMGESASYRIRAIGVSGVSVPSAVVTATLPAAGQPCTANATTLCLLDRFRVQIRWRNQRNGESGLAQAEALSDRSGSYWFFSPDNTELIVKVLDGRPVNGNFWVFYGALTDLEYFVAVADSVTGELISYRNLPGDICGLADTSATRGLGRTASGFEELLGSDLSSFFSRGTALPATARPPENLTEAAGSCSPNGRTLCLLENRFQVRVSWRTRDGATGVGTVRSSNDQIGTFSFFDADNIELVIKMLDGRGTNGNFWFFYGALSNVHYELEVVDTMTGDVQRYVNEQGNVCGGADVRAF